MNEQLKRILSQSDIEMSMTSFTGCLKEQDYLVSDSSINEFKLTKFAELIIQECIAQCEKNAEHSYLGPGSKLSAFNIKEHFGVKE